MLSQISPAWQQQRDQYFYDIGQAAGLLSKEGAAAPVTAHVLTGKLYKSKSGWLLLSVPNMVVRGLFDALHVPGAELPYHSDGTLNAHISVMRPEELEPLGGPDKINERGHDFAYTLGPIKEVEPAGWGEMSRVWFVEVQSPALKALRRSYGLTALPNNDQFQFHITIAVRRKKVLQNNTLAKAATTESRLVETYSQYREPHEIFMSLGTALAGVKQAEAKIDTPIPESAKRTKTLREQSYQFLRDSLSGKFKSRKRAPAGYSISVPTAPSRSGHG